MDNTYQSGNYTLFVPNDDAIHDYTEKLNDMVRFVKKQTLNRL